MKNKDIMDLMRATMAKIKLKEQPAKDIVQDKAGPEGWTPEESLVWDCHDCERNCYDCERMCEDHPGCKGTWRYPG
jgi:hypothetical protein